MFRLPFGRSVAEPESAASEEIWDLPDMAAVDTAEARHEHHGAAHFVFEDAPLHASGTFTAELAGWRPLDDHRVAWMFRSVPDSDAGDAQPAALPLLTGTTCRPDNHLCRVLVALELLPEAHSCDDLGDAAVRGAMREAVRHLNPDRLIGRRCRIRVEHYRDELGDVTARITRIAPVGDM